MKHTVKMIMGVMILGLSLGACSGYKPIYATNTDQSVITEMAAMDIAVINDREGQILRNLLIDSLTPKGSADQPLYRLKVTLSDQNENMAIDDDASLTQTQLVTKAKMVLERIEDGAVLSTQTATAFTTYAISDEQYGALVNRRDAKNRNLDQLARDIHRRLSIYFAQK